MSSKPDAPVAKRTTLTVGTRDSVLAKAQTSIVRDHLAKEHPDIEIKIVALKTSGDQNQITPLHQMERKSLWTQELEDLLLEHEVDIIVHSLKDMPTALPTNCCIGAILSREDPRDALVLCSGSPYTTLTSLPAGSVVGTSSVRRMAQISRRHPGIVLKDMRGNVLKRLSKLDDPALGYDALILAAAGLHRLGLHNRVSQYLDAEVGMLHAVGQGAIAVETREGDAEMAGLLKGLRCDETTKACLAERALLRKLEGGCSVPIGVETKWKDGRLEMYAVVASVDGTQAVEVTETELVNSDGDAEKFGVKVAGILLGAGAKAVLEEIQPKRPTLVD